MITNVSYFILIVFVVHFYFVSAIRAASDALLYCTYIVNLTYLWRK